MVLYLNLLPNNWTALRLFLIAARGSVVGTVQFDYEM